MYNQLRLDVEYKRLCQYQHLSYTKSRSVWTEPVQTMVWWRMFIIFNSKNAGYNAVVIGSKKSNVHNMYDVRREARWTYQEQRRKFEWGVILNYLIT